MTPTRRGFLLGTAALFSEPALARLPHGAATPAVGGNTLAVATYPEQALTSGVNGVARATQIVMGWTGVASTGVAAVWSGGGGSATITGFAVNGPFISFYASNPTSATGTLNLAITGTGPNTASASAIGIVVTAAVSDIATGITGPNNVMLGQAPFGNLNQGIASYLARGLAGPVQWSLTSITTGANFLISLSGVVTTGGAFTSLGSTLNYTVNATDGITSLTPLVVTVQNPASSVPLAVNTNNIALDSKAPDGFWSGYLGVSVAIVSTLYLWDGATSATMTDPSGFFYLESPSGGQYNILLKVANQTNYGTVNLTITPNGGSAFVYPITIAHEPAPTIAWVSNGPLTSATPPTNGYGTNQIGLLSGSSDSGISTMLLTSNPSGALNIYSYDQFFSRMGFAFLLNLVSAGTLSGTCQITSFAGITANMVLTLPVATGITYSSSDITVTPVSGLTNFSFPTAVAFPGSPISSDTTFTNGAINGTTFTFTGSSGAAPSVGMMIFGFYILQGTVLTGGSGLTWTVNQSQITAGATTCTGNIQTIVANGTVSGFTPNYALSLIDCENDNCQIPLWAPLTPEPAAPLSYLPRYSILGSGSTFIIQAWNGSASVDPTTREPTNQVDTLTLTLTDGNGNYCQQTFINTVSWHTYTGAALTCGPSGSGATWTSTDAMGAAICAAPATYAGATVTVLRGTDSSWHWTPFSGSSYFGWLLCPIYFKRDDSTQASFTGTISSVTGTGIYATGTLAVSSVTGTIVAYDFILIGGTAAGIIPVSGSGSTWTVNGPGVVAMSGIVMTTQQPQIPANFGGAAPAGNFQGGFAGGGGFDVIWKGFEGYNCSNGTNAGTFYKFDGQVGNMTLVYCYAHDSNMGFLGGDLSTEVNIYDSLFGGCGPGNGGGSHNVYIGPCARLRFLRSRSHDAWGHELKMRAMNALVMNNFIIEGCNWEGLDSPVQHAQGGLYTISNNIIMKGCDDHAANTGNIIDCYDECSGANGRAAEPAWAANNLTIENNTIINTVVPGQAPPYQPAVGFNQVQGNVDPIRNIPWVYNIINNSLWNLPSAQWAGGSFGGSPPTLGSGNAGVATFPGTNLDLINPLTGAPPQRLLLRHNVIASAPGPSNTVTPYATVLKLPSGASAGTNIALIGAYDGAEVQMNPSVMTASGTQFTVTATSADTGTIQNVGTLADGVYYTQITATGTGTPNLPQPQFFAIVVGAGTVPPS